MLQENANRWRLERVKKRPKVTLNFVDVLEVEMKT